MRLHDLQELDDDLRGRSEEHLALAALLGVRQRLERISKHIHLHLAESSGSFAARETSAWSKRMFAMMLMARLFDKEIAEVDQVAVGRARA